MKERKKKVVAWKKGTTRNKVTRPPRNKQHHQDTGTIPTMHNAQKDNANANLSFSLSGYLPLILLFLLLSSSFSCYPPLSLLINDNNKERTMHVCPPLSSTRAMSALLTRFLLVPASLDLHWYCTYAKERQGPYEMHHHTRFKNTTRASTFTPNFIFLRSPPSLALHLTS